MIQSVILQIIFSVLMFTLGVKIEDHGGYGYIGIYSVLDSSVPIKSMDDFKDAFNREYPFIAIVFLFFSAFGVAALVEELSKYFGFKIVDHPDFLQEDELRSAAQHGISLREQRGKKVKPRYEWGGGLDYSMEVENTSSQLLDTDTDDTMNIPIELQECPPRSASSLGTAITVAMVAVALGFACCENLIYIYIYTGQSLDMEISVLISRSLFPIHPLCAAIQSIWVCKQVVEKDVSVGIGQIILPSILLHGSYDFVIMLLNFLVTVSRQKKDQDEPEPMIVTIIALISSVGFVICGSLYYIRESRAQSSRLNQMDRPLSVSSTLN